MTPELLKQIMPYASIENCKKFAPHLSKAMEDYEINKPRRIAAFLAQLAHESGSLNYVKEIASGEAYEGRTDLGNTQPGDGVKFKGRGLIQITGRANYAAISKELNYDFIANPESLEKPGAASYSAAWFWWFHHLNRLADIDAFEKITRVINGGLNGIEDRKKHYARAKKVLEVEERDIDSPANIG